MEKKWELKVHLDSNEWIELSGNDMVNLKSWCDNISPGPYRDGTIKVLNPYLTKQVKLLAYHIINMIIAYILYCTMAKNVYFSFSIIDRWRIC